MDYHFFLRIRQEIQEMIKYEIFLLKKEKENGERSVN